MRRSLGNGFTQSVPEQIDNFLWIGRSFGLIMRFRDSGPFA